MVFLIFYAFSLLLRQPMALILFGMTVDTCLTNHGGHLVCFYSVRVIPSFHEEQQHQSFQQVDQNDM